MCTRIYYRFIKFILIFEISLEPEVILVISLILTSFPTLIFQGLFQIIISFILKFFSKYILANLFERPGNTVDSYTTISPFLIIDEITLVVLIGLKSGFLFFIGVGTVTIKITLF